MRNLLTFLIAFAPIASYAQVQNDATAPLHLMRPAYRYSYGAPKPAEVKSSMDRILHYLDSPT